MDKRPLVLGGFALAGLVIMVALLPKPAPPPSGYGQGAFGETAQERETRLARASIDDPSLDARILKDAIVVAHSDASGVTADDVPIIRAGARMILKTRADCPFVTDSDAVMNEPGRYYVTCSSGKTGVDAQSHNYFFSKDEVIAATGRDPSGDQASGAGK